MAKHIGMALTGALVLGLAAAPAYAAVPACQMIEVGALPVTMRGNLPLVIGELNGKPVRMMIDTGSAATMIVRSAAHDLALLEKPTSGVIFYGAVGGNVAFTATVHDLKLGKLVIRDADLLELRERKAFDDVAGVIGEDILSHADLEIDLAGGAIRFFAPKNCSGDQVVYWGKAYSVAPIVTSNDSRDLAVEIELNGKAIRANLDSGVSASVVAPSVAQLVGVTSQSGGAAQPSRSVGVGGQIKQTYAGIFPTFSFGDETIRNARLLIADLFQADKTVEIGYQVPTSTYKAPQMLLGADFMRAHRVYIARSQNKVYVSYQGGPVFETPQGATSAVVPPVPSPSH